ncbi:MAG: diaminopimelate epimerase [Elusimicrobia bacterium]|nr:diaminopimelate epimerase [Elusimicrobiota bacterium]
MRGILEFWKLCAAGNDFVLVRSEDASRIGMSLKRLAQVLCNRRRGVGGDGLLVVDRRKDLPAVSYLNSDGSAAFCGNGTRAAALWLYLQGITRKARAFSFMSSAGLIHAKAAPDGRTASIRMPDPKGLRLGLKLSVPGWRGTAHSVDTGVPHLVVPVRELDGFDVAGVGRALRRHPAFRPAGANVDFVTLGPRRVVMRTYERGVEDETLACGTGAVAAAVVAAALGSAEPPVKVLVRGGDVLQADFHLEGGAAREVWLQGPASIVYTGGFPC